MELLEGIGEFLMFVVFLVVILGFIPVVIALFSKVTGQSVTIKEKYSSGPGNTYKPSDIDDFTESLSEATKDALQSSNRKILKTLKGAYQYLFDKIEKLSLNKSDASLSLADYLNLVKQIEQDNKIIRSINPENYSDHEVYIIKHISEKQLSEKQFSDYVALKKSKEEKQRQLHYKYGRFLSGVNLDSFLNYLKDFVNFSDEKSFYDFLENIGVQNCKQLYDIVSSIDREFWANTINQDERNKLMKYLLDRKISSLLNK